MSHDTVIFAYNNAGEIVGLATADEIRELTREGRHGGLVELVLSGEPLTPAAIAAALPPMIFGY